MMPRFKNLAPELAEAIHRTLARLDVTFEDDKIQPARLNAIKQDLLGYKTELKNEMMRALEIEKNILMMVPEYRHILNKINEGLAKVINQQFKTIENEVTQVLNFIQKLMQDARKSNDEEFIESILDEDCNNAIMDFTIVPNQEILEKYKIEIQAFLQPISDVPNQYIQHISEQAALLAQLIDKGVSDITNYPKFRKELAIDYILGSSEEIVSRSRMTIDEIMDDKEGKLSKSAELDKVKLQKLVEEFLKFEKQQKRLKNVYGQIFESKESERLFKKRFCQQNQIIQKTLERIDHFRKQNHLPVFSVKAVAAEFKRIKQNVSLTSETYRNQLQNLKHIAEALDPQTSERVYRKRILLDEIGEELLRINHHSKPLSIEVVKRKLDDEYDAKMQEHHSDDDCSMFSSISDILNLDAAELDAKVAEHSAMETPSQFVGMLLSEAEEQAVGLLGGEEQIVVSQVSTHLSPTLTTKQRAFCIFSSPKVEIDKGGSPAGLPLYNLQWPI